MEFKSLSRWTVSTEMEGLLFFAQRFDELVWDYTLDTYKPMSLNAPYLCKEALDVIDNIESELIDSANLAPVINELLWSVRNDPIARSMLDLPIERYVGNDDTKLPDRKRRLSALSGTLEPYRYLDRCLHQLSESVKLAKKSSIDSIARTLVTTLINMGVSKKSLQEKVNKFFFYDAGDAISSADRIDDFLKIIYPRAHRCDVYFVVSDLIKTIGGASKAFDVEIIDNLPDDLAELQLKTTAFECGQDECYVSVKSVHALDVFSAQEKAANVLDRLSDLYTLFHHQRKVTWRDTALVKQCCLPDPVATVLAKGAMEKPYDFPPDKASKQLKLLIENIAIRGPSLARFDRVADLHGICVASDVIDNQLVMLWTSLETLIPSTTHGTKIVNVLNQMMPFLMQSYISRIVQRFAHDLFNWNRWYTKRLLKKIPGVSGANTIQRVVVLLAVEDNKALLSDLYGELRDFHLLRNRAYQLSKLLSSPEALRERLETHRTKVEWQIRRIYRTRNMLVHSGKRPTYIGTLVENAHDYLDQIIFEVMRLSCGEYRAKTLDDVFELVKVRYEKFNMILSNAKKFDADNCAFLCNEVNALTDFKNITWDNDR